MLIFDDNSNFFSLKKMQIEIHYVYFSLEILRTSMFLRGTQ